MEKNGVTEDVTLSAAKGLETQEQMLRSAQHDNFPLYSFFQSHRKTG
jgi:hypothetical protein